MKQAALTQPWDSMPEYLRDGYRRAAASSLAAVLPLVADHLESLAVNGNGWQAGMESAAEILRDAMGGEA